MASGAAGKVGGGGGGGGAAYGYGYEAEVVEKRWRPWLVPVIVVACVVVFVVEMLVNDCPAHVSPGGDRCFAGFLRRVSFQPLHENPLLGPSSATLEEMGGLVWDKVVHQHQGWRLLSSIWLHAGLIHLVVNMLSLLFIGIRLEQQFGFVRVGLIYILSGFGANVLSSLFLQGNYVSIGASGSLFGLIGSMLAELIMNWTLYSNKAAAMITLLVIVIINLGIGLLPHVDNFAHIGGLISGFLLGFVFLARPQYGWLERNELPQASRPTSKYQVYQYALWVLALLLLIAGFAVSLVMLFKGENGNDNCHWCHYLNCVPTARWSCDG